MERVLKIVRSAWLPTVWIAIGLLVLVMLPFVIPVALGD